MMEINSLKELISKQFTNVTRITISSGLTVFPEEIFQHVDTLEILDFSNNSLSEIPGKILDFKKLKILFLSNNKFTIFPHVLGRSGTLTMIGFKSNQIKYIPKNALPKKLQWLILTNNKIEILPASIGNCLNLQKVALAGNKLKTLPNEMAKCKNIQLLRISANELIELPGWLLQLPKLAWLAYSGNPFTDDLTILKPLELINWNDLLLQEKLGEGASGIISKAFCKNSPNEYPKTLAVKVFKGEVTSDGFPEDEMNVSAIIPKHKNLITVVGKINNHPENKNGLIFELIPPSYFNLGMPPSFETCSRDTFKDETIFSVKTILHIASSIANAVMHLHLHGIMHGDLYAHNILINEEADSLIGDFGAATPYDRNGANAALLERIEVCAFGYFLDDLLQQINDQQKRLTVTIKLIQLKDECLREEILMRPDFEYLNDELKRQIEIIS